MNTHDLDALARLVDAADAYSADQSGATDKRCGLVQPITVAEGQELNDAMAAARAILARAEPGEAGEWMGPWKCKECGRIDLGGRVTMPDGKGGFYHKHGRTWGECYGEYVPYDRRHPAPSPPGALRDGMEECAACRGAGYLPKGPDAGGEKNLGNVSLECGGYCDT